MNDISKVNIFITHTPLQNFIAAKIATQFYGTKEYKNVLYSSVSVEDTSVFDDYMFINKGRFFKKILSTYLVKRKIERLIKYNKTRVFISHTAALLDNYFFYSFPLQRYNADINLFYEGILYFYEYRQKIDTKEHSRRKIYGRLCNMQYQPKSIILPVEDNRVKQIFSILPEFTLGPIDKIRKVSILKNSYACNENTILIMGGKPSLLENIEVISIYSEMIKKIKSFDRPLKIYFKGHHADTSDNFKIANKEQIEVEDISQNSPIEEVIEIYKPSLVLSYPSSGLINLKAMYGGEINMISYYIEKKKDQIEYLNPVFESLEIQLKVI